MMDWSIAKSKIFLQCQRKWYYYELAAHPKARDTTRKEVYHLKQLQSINAWRGSLVDTVIAKIVTPSIKARKLPSEKETIDFALRLMQTQISFGKEKKHRQPYITKTKAGDTYCAFYDLEYKGELDEESLKQAEKDITCALKNLLSSELIQDIANNNLHIISQRTLTFNPFEDIRVKCVPDLIVFFKEKAPLIIDWKVHTTGNTDAWLQLGIYALALSQVNPHKDFPNFREQVENISNIGLIEYQLLSNKQRKYSVSSNDVLDIEDYIFKSSMQMKRLVDSKKFNDLDIRRFRSARSPAICERCQFKKLCWNAQSETKPVQQLLFEVF